MTNTRLDAALVARGLARSRGQASELVAAGHVTVNGREVRRAAHQVEGSDLIAVAAPDPYVSRAARKLLGALDASGTAVRGRALDAGASTGGFTQVLLERGCAPVYAVDVGHGQLAPSVAGDPRVVVREGLNLRDLVLSDVGGEPVDVVVADVSFISLRLLLEPLLSVVRADGVALLLVKPQFELGRAALDSQGIVADPRRGPEAVQGVVEAALRHGWREAWRGESQLPGAAGNREFFVKLLAAAGSGGPATTLGT